MQRHPEHHVEYKTLPTALAVWVETGSEPVAQPSQQGDGNSTHPPPAPAGGWS